MRMALEERDMKILGRPVKYVTRDGATQAGTSTRRAEEAIDGEGARFMIGPWSSGVALAVSEVAKRKKVLHFFSGSHPDYHKPSDSADHINAAELGAMLRIRFFAGVLIGARRADRWTWPRRLAYIAGSPLISALLVWRVQSVVRFSAVRRKLPGGTMVGIILGAVVSALGEAVGYLGIRLPSAESQLIDVELHKLRYGRLGTQMSGS